jgi:DNA topoisomerase-1
LIRENKRGEKFLSCSGYPDCTESFNIDAQGNPMPSHVETEHVCEKCGKPMALRQGPRGPFLGCTGYPKCRNILPVDSAGKPVQTVKIDVKCEKCGKPLAVRQGRRGPFLGCTGYPRCRGTAPVPDELKEQLAELAPAAPASPAADLNAIEVGETCDDCGSTMVVRRGRRGYFLGCSKYPKCKGTKEPGEATQQKISAVMGG